jgi:hypothetical protein
MPPHTFGLLFQSRSEDPRAALDASANLYLRLSPQVRCEGREDKILVSRQCLPV